MSTEYSTLKVEPNRIRISCGFRSTLLFEPVELVEESAADGGRDVVLRSPANASRFVVAGGDEESLAIIGRLPRASLDADEVETLKQRIALASKPLDPNFDRFTDEQIRRRKPTSWIDRATGWRKP